MKTKTHLLLYTGMFLTALSKEKEEDEMIAGLRINSVAITVYIVFILHITGAFIMAFDHGFRFMDASWPYFLWSNAYTLVLISFAIYIALFKFRLWYNRHDCK